MQHEERPLDLDISTKARFKLQQNPGFSSARGTQCDHCIGVRAAALIDHGQRGGAEHDALRLERDSFSRGFYAAPNDAAEPVAARPILVADRLPSAANDV